MRIGDTPDTVDELPARSVRHGRPAGPPTLLAALVLLVGVLIGCGGSDTATTAAPPDAHVWRKVGETLGLELQSEHGTRSADLPRTDLHVHSQGHRVSTGLEVTNEFRLKGLSGGVC